MLRRRRRSMSPPIDLKNETSGEDLLELILSWMEKKELCAQQLKKQAEELERIRGNCNISEAVGSTSCVLGGACLLGAGLATLLTGGAAGVVVAAGLAGSGLGTSVCVGTKITEKHLSTNILKKAKQTEIESNKIEERIQEMLHQLKVKKKKTGSKEPDDVDQTFVNEFLTAWMRRGGGNSQNQSYNAENITAVFAFLMTVTFLMEKKNTLLLGKAGQKLIRGIAAVGIKNVLKGGAMALGGAVEIAISLPEAIENWENLIKNNHVTEASRSLRNTADQILTTIKEVREQLDRICDMT